MRVASRSNGAESGTESQSNKSSGISSDANNRQGSAKPWTNQNVIFCHADLDDAQIPAGPFRLLLHLERRIGHYNVRSLDELAKQPQCCPGIELIAKTCRMNRTTVRRDLRWLEKNGYILMLLGRGGDHNRYLINRANVPRGKVYIDHRLDDAGLSVSEIRVLAHISRLSNDAGNFFINYRKFADVTGLSLNTVKATLDSLRDREHFEAYDFKKNPMWCLQLSELLPRQGVSK